MLCKRPYPPLSSTFLSDGPDERIKAPFFPPLSSQKRLNRVITIHSLQQRGLLGAAPPPLFLPGVGGLTRSEPKVGYLSPLQTAGGSVNADIEDTVLLGGLIERGKERPPAQPTLPSPPVPQPLDEKHIPAKGHSSGWRIEGRNHLPGFCCSVCLAAGI